MNTQEILSKADNISLEQLSTTDQSKLCQIWPVVKEGLQLLSAVIKNPVVQVVINGIIAAGDAIVGRVCK